MQREGVIASLGNALGIEFSTTIMRRASARVSGAWTNTTSLRISA
jgi:hypothetical protein